VQRRRPDVRIPHVGHFPRAETAHACRIGLPLCIVEKFVMTGRGAML
jgi:hypothetical protein